MTIRRVEFTLERATQTVEEDQVILVPRQLQRTGMTGNVPYYGGRFSPAQAYAASHSVRPAPPPSQPQTPADPAATLDALEHLRATGVLSDEEYVRLRARVVT